MKTLKHNLTTEDTEYTELGLKVLRIINPFSVFSVSSVVQISIRESVYISVFVLSCCGLAVCGFAQDEPFKYDSRNRRDPFAALVTKDGRIVAVQQADSPDGPSGMRLEGILYDPEGESIAVLNGKIVKKGDKIGVYEVMQISPYDIVLSDIENNSIILNLKSQGQAGDKNKEGI